MKKNRFQKMLFIGITSTLLIAQGTSLQAFDEFPIGARPAALSGAYTAGGDDIYSLYYNPAGLAKVRQPEVTAYYARLFPSLTDQTDSSLTFLAYGHPLFKDKPIWGTVSVGLIEFKLDSLFKERTLIVGYGRPLSLSKPILSRLTVGANLKALQRKFGTNADTQNAFQGNNPANRLGIADPVFNNGLSAQAFALDLGGRYQFSNKISLGLNLANFNTPDMGLSQKDKVPMIVRTGASYKVPFLKAHVEIARRHFLDKDPDHRILFGAERTWTLQRYGDVSLRGGGGVGNRDFRQVTMGMGYEFNGVGVDYVFQIPMGALDSTGNTHQLSLSFKFGKAPHGDELDSLIKAEKDATARAEAALKLAEAESSFIKEDRDQLLVEVEKLKGQLKTAIKSGPKKPILTAEEKARAARKRALREFTVAYNAAMRAYSKKVQGGATLSDRARALQRIINKYKSKGVNVSKATREINNVKTELAQAETDFRITWEFYKKTVAQGADQTERISLLDRMIKKYRKSGIDLSEIEKELEILKKTR